MPNGGGSGPFGPCDRGCREVRFRPAAPGRPCPLPARLLPPVVRTAADDPSFSPGTDPRTWTPARIKAAGRGDEGSERSLKVTPQRARTTLSEAQDAVSNAGHRQ
ncbi:hypothetical protein GCM10020220_106450 [Nonomuraea rubra]